MNKKFAWLLMLLVISDAPWGLSKNSVKSERYTLSVSVKNIIQKGVLYAGVCDSESSYKKREPVLEYSKAVPIKEIGDQELVFELPPGVYSIAFFLDLNGNGVLDFRFGKPIEMVGMTNNPRKTGHPGWKDGAFQLDKSSSTVVLLHQK